jgi:hypothetical protein
MQCRTVMVSSNVMVVMSVAFCGVGCTGAAPIGASSAQTSTGNVSRTAAPTAAAASVSPAGTSTAAAPLDTGVQASSTSHSADVAASPFPAAARATSHLYQQWRVSDPLAADEVPFASGPFPAPAPGEEMWVLDKVGPVGKGRVVRWIPVSRDGNLCGGPSTVFILRMRAKPRGSAIIAVHPVGAWSAPPKARGYYGLPPAASAGSPEFFKFGVDFDGDGALDIAETSHPGACQDLPAAQRLPFDSTYEGCDGEYCSEIWARSVTGKLQVAERVSHGFRSLGY